MRFTNQVNELCHALNSLGVPTELVLRARNLLLTSDEDINPWIDLAIELRKQQYYHASLLTYDTALHCFPDDKYILNNRGVLLFVWGRQEEALQSFERAIELDPTYMRAFEGRADVYLAMQNFLAAAEGFREVLNNDPARPECWNKLGNCLREIDRREEAKAAYEQAILLDPVYTDPLFNLAALLNEDRNFNQAFEVVNRLLAIDPDDDQAQQLQREILTSPVSPTKLEPYSVKREDLVIRLSLAIDPDINNEDNLSFSEISRMSRDEAARQVGYEAWDIAHLTELINAGIDEVPPPLSKPPSLFISYRWGDEEHNAWVSRFASDLEARGYDVIFDRQVQAKRNPLPVPELVSLMLKCNLFVPILTEPYRRRVEMRPGANAVIEDGWVYDEFQITLHLGKIGRLQFIGIWRSGPVVPSPLRPDTVNDFRDDDSYSQSMDKIFPPRMAIIVGYRYDGTQHIEGPIERIRVEEVGRVLQASGEFKYFGILHL